MRIIFKKIEILNFKSFADEIFEFDNCKGLNLICGKNNDIQGSKNGVGKCLDPNTQLTIKTFDSNILNVLNIHSNESIVTIKAIYDLFQRYPEYRGKIDVLTRFGFYPILNCAITAFHSRVIKITTELNKELKTSPNHLLCTASQEWVEVHTLSVNDEILTKDGKEKIIDIYQLSKREDLYDLEVYEKHEFYANGIVSHNSALSDALVYSLFGQTKDNIKNENICNKFINTKEMRVVTYFDIGEQQYKVASGHDIKSRPYCHLYEITNGEEVDITKSTMSETRKYLVDEILHCDLSIFLRTILLSSDHNYNFFRLRKWEKKEFIEKLFDISVFGDMYDKIHRDILDFDKKLLAKQNKLIILNKNNDDYQQRIEKYNTDKENKISMLTENLKTLQSEQENIKNLNIKENTTEVSKYEDALDQLNDTIRKINDKINDVEKNQRKIEVSTHKLQSSKEQKQKTIDKHAELLAKLCKDCKQIFSDYYNISTYLDEIKEIDEKVAKLAETNTQLEAKHKEFSEKLTACNEKVKKVNTKIKQLTEEYNSAQKKLTVLDTKISTIEYEIAKVEKTENPYTELQQTNQLELDTEVSELNEMSQKYKYLKFAENIVSQDTLRKFIINDLVGLLNNKIKTYLTKFGAQYDVVFDADMNYVFTTAGGQCEFDNFSSGERARLMIASCFAFRDFMYIRNNFSSNILFLDEFIDGAIDSLAIESILEILKDFCELWDQNIFVVSHRKEVNNDIFDRIIQVVKTNNISKITYL